MSCASGFGLPVSADFAPARFHLLSGESGGLLRVLGLLDLPESGEVLVGGRATTALDEEARAELRAQLRAAHEVQRVPEEVSRFLATTAEVQLQQPEITGLAVPVAFTLHVPVQRDGECEYEHYGGVLQEEATKETSMLALEMLLKEVFFRDASENLARALGIAGGVFDTARWPDAVIAQADV